jgi:hypothetical protein
LHGWNWLKSPIVIGLVVVVAIHIGLTFRRSVVARDTQSAPKKAATASGNRSVDLGLLLALAATALFAGGIGLCGRLAFDSLLVPMLAAIPGLTAALMLVGMRLRGASPSVPWPPHEEAKQLGFLGAGIAAIPFTGFFPALGVYLAVMLWTRSRLRLLIVPYVAAILATAYGLSRAFNIPVP